ncbi:MAG: response regulator, partial [Planctomycetota bacterium]
MTATLDAAADLASSTHTDPVNIGAARPDPGLSPSRASAPSAALIHVIDDDNTLSSSLRMLLETHGHRVETWPHAESYLDHIEDLVRPSCLIIDLRMPGIGGQRLIEN